MSIDGEVLRSMKPLKELNLIDTTRQSIYDADDDQDHIRPHKLLYCADIFHALRERHSESIKHLTIESDGLLTASVMTALWSFVSSATTLHTLSLQLIDLDIRSLLDLSKDLQSIKIVLNLDHMPSLVEADLSDTHSALPHLRELQYEAYRSASGRLLCRLETSNYGKER